MTLNSEGLEKLKPCPFCGKSLYLTEGAVRWWKHQVTFPPEATCPSMSAVSIEEWPERDDAAIGAWNRRALPPVDGLEVAAWEHKLTGIIRQRGDKPSLGVSDGDYEELCRLSQASSVIAGLKEDCEQYKEAGHAYYARALKAEARVSSLEEQNKRLKEALSRAERSFNNIRGAIESNQVVDKDAHGTAVRARDAARKALEDHNG